MTTKRNIRRQMVATINANAGPRADLERQHGQVRDTSQLQEDFRSWALPLPSSSFVGGRMACGAVMFQNSPRFYYSFQPE